MCKLGVPTKTRLHLQGYADSECPPVRSITKTAVGNLIAGRQVNEGFDLGLDLYHTLSCAMIHTQEELMIAGPDPPLSGGLRSGRELRPTPWAAPGYMHVT